MQNLKILFKKQLLLSLLFLVFSPAVMAQDNSYTPPPMFDAPPPLPPANAPVTAPAVSDVQKPVIEKPIPKAVEPSSKPVPKKISKPVSSEKPAIQKREETLSKVSSNNLAPIPKKKPDIAPAVKEVQSAKATEENDKPQAVVSDVNKQVEKPNGVVKGPKTMPAVPAGKYEAEVVYNAQTNQAEGAILRRHMETGGNDGVPSTIGNASSVPPLPDAPRLDIYEEQGGKAKKLVIPYDKAQKAPKAGMLEAFLVTTMDILKDNPDWRIQILSYASPFDAGQSSDRRMALTRALDLREALLTYGIEPRRIDVRALGEETQEQMKDRADILFLAQ